MKHKSHLLLLWALLLSLSISGQTSFIGTYESVNGSRASSVITMSDGNILTGGKTASFTSGDNDNLLIKTDTAGNVIWTKTFGTSEENEIVSMAAISTNSYAILAKDMVGGISNLTFIVIDLSGNITAQRTFSLSTGIGYFCKLTALANGNVLIYETISNKVVMACLDNTGAEVWTKDISVAASGITLSSVNATEMTNGYIAIVCNSDYGTSLPQISFYLNIITSGGSLISSQLFSTTSDIRASKIYCSPTTGNLYICGTANSSRFLILKLDNSGAVLWVKSFDTTFLSFGGTLDVTFDPTNDYMTILGNSIGPGFEIDRYDSDGNFLWSNGGPSHSETPIGITTDASGNYFVTGHMPSVATGFSDVFFCRVSSNGYVCSHAANTFWSISNYTAAPATVVFNDNGNINITDNPITYTTQSPTLSKSVSCTFNVGIDESAIDEFFSLRSTIVSNELIIDSKVGFTRNEMISVSDLSGRIVYTGNVDDGNVQMVISTTKLSEGAYFLSILKSGSRTTKNFIVQR